MEQNLFNQDRFEAYFELFISRFIHSSLSLNKPNKEIDDAQNIFRLYDQTLALKRIFEIVLQEKRSITEEDVIELASIINKHAMYISDGYRQTGHTFADTQKPITDPEKIPSEMHELFQKYETEWQQLPILKRITKFHMRFLSIHPFEDGNGRVSRMILCAQLLKEGLFPFLITQDKLRVYQESLFYDQEEELLKLFEEQYQKEKKYATLFFQEKTRNEDHGRNL